MAMSERGGSEGLLKGWQREFARRNFCPWPGPRPIETAHDDNTLDGLQTIWDDVAMQLRGRQAAVADLAVACISNDLLVIHGQSGVGKTSLGQSIAKATNRGAMAPMPESAGHRLIEAEVVAVGSPAASVRRLTLHAEGFVGLGFAGAAAVLLLGALPAWRASRAAVQ